MKGFDISKLRINPNNPFPFNGNNDDWNDFKKKLDRDPEFLEANKIAYDSSRDNLVIAGNKRVQGLRELGWKTIPAKYVIDCKDWSEEKRQRYIFASNWNIGEWDFSFIDESEAEEWNLSFDDIVDEDYPSNDGQVYTSKVEIPIYEPSEDKPTVSDLYDDSKFNQLIEEINKADISDEERLLLTLASYRQIVFNFKKIADYYAHTNNATLQNLMEKNAMVIIDFDKAVEYGYVQIGETLKKRLFNE